MVKLAGQLSAAKLIKTKLSKTLLNKPEEESSINKLGDNGFLSRTINTQKDKTPTFNNENPSLNDIDLNKIAKNASGLLNNLLAITLTQPIVKASVEARAAISKSPDNPINKTLKDSFITSPTKLIKEGFSSDGIGRSVLDARVISFAGVGSAGDAMMSEILPVPKGINSTEDLTTVATRSLAKSVLETGLTIKNEANRWHNHYQSKEPILKYAKGLLPGVLTRNSTIWLGVETAKAIKNEDASNGLGASAVIGMASGFAAGMIDNYCTLAKAASGTNSPKQPSRLAATMAAGALRAFQAGVTTSALVGFSSINFGFDDKNTEIEQQKQAGEGVFSDGIKQAAESQLSSPTSSWVNMIKSEEKPTRQK